MIINRVASNKFFRLFVILRILFRIFPDWPIYILMILLVLLFAGIFKEAVYDAKSFHKMNI